MYTLYTLLWFGQNPCTKARLLAKDFGADVTIEALEVEDLGSFHACAKCETANSNLHRVFQKHIFFVRLAL